MSKKSSPVLLKVSFKRCVFSAVLKTLFVALALILFGSVFQAFAGDTVNDRTPHEVLNLCSVNSSMFAERIFPRSGSYGLTRLHMYLGETPWIVLNRNMEIMKMIFCSIDSQGSCLRIGTM